MTGSEEPPRGLRKTSPGATSRLRTGGTGVGFHRAQGVRVQTDLSGDLPVVRVHCRIPGLSPERARTPPRKCPTPLKVPESAVSAMEAERQPADDPADQMPDDASLPVKAGRVRGGYGTLRVT